MNSYFATCARGLEPVLAGELRRLAAADVRPGRGGVAFAGGRDLLYKANLHLRTAVRVLAPILRAAVRSPEELYDAVSGVDWSKYLTPDRTLAVDCNVSHSRLTHSHYAALKTKDAVCDQFVRKVGRRPSVDTERPAVKLNLHVAGDQAVLSLDGSGDSLHKRGYRKAQSRAPLNEALAAGLVLLTGYDGSQAFADPMCGSGTLVVEAAWRALGRPPGLTREHFGFMGWPDFDAGLWDALRDDARRAVRAELPATVAGSDVRADALAHAAGNARGAGVGHLVALAQRDLKDFAPPPGDAGVLLCNPPYGERIGDAAGLRRLYRLIGQVAGRLPYGWQVYVFTTEGELADAVGVPAARRVPLYNGRLRCQLVQLDLT